MDAPTTDPPAPPAPPKDVRWRYYLFETRVPPSWERWVVADIASFRWLARELGRFLALYVLLAGAVGRFRFTWPSLSAFAVGVAAIAAGRRPLREIAVAYQRYGWDWSAAPKMVVRSWLRIGYAVLFSVVIILLLR